MLWEIIVYCAFSMKLLLSCGLVWLTGRPEAGIRVIRMLGRKEKTSGNEIKSLGEKLSSHLGKPLK